MVNYEAKNLDLLFGALADPSRRQMVLTLRAGETTVEELGRPLGFSLPGVMKHVAILERSGLVVTEKRGRSRYCRLEPERLADGEQWLAEIRTFWAANLTRLADQLEQE